MSRINSNELYNKWIIHINKNNSYTQTGGTAYSPENGIEFKSTLFDDTADSKIKEQINGLVKDSNIALGQITEKIEKLKKSTAMVAELQQKEKLSEQLQKQLATAKEDLKKSITTQNNILNSIKTQLGQTQAVEEGKDSGSSS